jgi:flagellar biosynthetic protein FliR
VDALSIIERSMGPAMLVVLRLGGLFLYAPVLSMTSIPGRVKGMLVVVAGVGAYLVLAGRGVAFPRIAFDDPWAMVPLGAAEIAIGGVIGFVASMPVFAMRAGGLIMGQQMGLGFARFYNPAAGEESDVLEQIFSFLAVVLFLALGGLDAMFLCVLRSFEHVNAGGFVGGAGAVELVVGVMLAATEFGLRIAMPLLGVVFLETIAMGFVSKTVPQLNVLSLGFPIRILVGLAVVIVALPVFMSVSESFTTDVLEAVVAWSETAADPGGGA